MILASCIKGASGQDKAGWLIKFGYDPAFLNQFKAEIPGRHREWISAKKTWWVDELYEDVLDELFDNFEALARPQGAKL